MLTMDQLNDQASRKWRSTTFSFPRKAAIPELHGHHFGKWRIYLPCMKRRAEPTAESKVVGYDSQPDSLVILPRDDRAPRTVSIEWRDCAGELHWEVLSPELSAGYLTEA
jgi:hypothetical protein